jgi:hypothetical protein
MRGTCIFWSKISKIAPCILRNSKNAPNSIVQKKKKKGLATATPIMAIWGWLEGFGVVSATPIWPLGGGQPTPMGHVGGSPPPIRLFEGGRVTPLAIWGCFWPPTNSRILATHMAKGCDWLTPKWPQGVTTATPNIF